MPSQFHLLGKRRFLPFFGTQFLGAFNDNLFKNALVVILTFQAASWTTLDPSLLANLAAGIFILPFFLFSATAGQLADKYDKAALARLVKLLEIAIMGLAALGFALHSLPLLLTALFLLGGHSTLFGPVKYAILPQHLHPQELIGGNALVEAATFAAILLGTLAGGLLAGLGNAPGWISLGGLLVALAGYLASRGIPAAPAPAPELQLNPNPLVETWRNLRLARQNPSVFPALLAISWFWLFGALFLAQFPAYARHVLGGDETSVTLLLGIFTMGIGGGSLLCERLSRQRLALWLVPLGGIGMSLFGAFIALASPAPPAITNALPLSAILTTPGVPWALLALLLLGISGGLFIVPLYALMQVRSAPAQRARIVAANNILNALFMVVGALGAGALLSNGLSIPALFAAAAALNILALAHLCWHQPEYLQRSSPPPATTGPVSGD